MAMNHSSSLLPLNVHDSDDREHSSAPPAFDYAVPDARHPRVDSLSHSTRGSHYSPAISPESPFSSDYDLKYMQSPQSIGHATLESPRDRKTSTSLPGRLSDNLSVSGAMNAPHQRSSQGSASTSSYTHHIEHLGGSDTWSPTSSRGQGHHNSDEQIPRFGLTKTNSKNEKDEEGSKNEEEDPPSWSELKTKAGKERKRLPLACIACRRKKIRCSGEKPACKHCLRSRVPCVYKVTARKAAPRTDYMAMLDKRLKRMEERVIKVIPKEDLPDFSATGRAVVRPALPVPVSKPSKSSPTKKRTADEAFAKELDDWTQARAKPLPDHLGQPRHSRDSEKTLLTEGAECLPSKELQEHLAEVFFDCVYGQSYLLLHKPSFMRKLKAGTVPPVLILAVCAISARFSTHPEVNTEPAFLRGDMWATPARAIVERRHGEPNITLLIVMVILGLHYFGTCEGGLSWSFGGQAMRMAFALQLHRELDHDPLSRKNDKASELSFTDREIRRRTMWASFLMDRFNASGTERPPFGSEEFLRIQLPIKESHFQMEIPGPTEDLDGNSPPSVATDTVQLTDPKENMGVAAFVIRAVVLWGRIVKYLNLGGKDKDKHPIWSPESGFAKLRESIDCFRKSMPPSMVYNVENLQNHAAERVANQFLYLHIICQQNMLFLYRFAIPVSPNACPPKDMPKQFLSDAGRCVVESASQISHLIEQAAGHLLTAPFAGYCAYVASTVQVWGIFSKNPQLETVSKENLRHNYKYLSKMKKYWGMLHYMAENVKDIYRHFADAASKSAPSTAESSDAESPLFQYGDWFDKYPRGVAGHEWNDTLKDDKKETGSEAAMSQRSDLQSVEEFFASLSPQIKTESTKKAARRNTRKAGDIKSMISSQDPVQTSPRTSQHQQQQQQQPPPPPLRRQSQSRPQSQHHLSIAPSQTSHPRTFSTTSADYMTNSLQQHYQPQMPQTSAFNLTPQPFDFNTSSFYPTTPLSHLDRQLVFGAYANMDGTVNNNLTSGGGYMWEGIDMNAAFGSIGSGPGGGVNTGLEAQEPSSAWFMPFNMDPPQIGEVDASMFLSPGAAAAGAGGSFSDQSMGDVGMADGHAQP
jgi:Fungal specific transcription factor domain/Fungal Zn(2)-Cys(6) binuclear cluster domain